MKTLANFHTYFITALSLWKNNAQFMEKQSLMRQAALTVKEFPCIKTTIKE